MKKETENFKNLIDGAVQKGYRFLFISDLENFGVANYMYKDKIVNNVLLEQVKQKVCNEVPFYCPDDLFEKARTIFFKLVDNSISEADILHLSGKQFGAIITILHVMMYILNMEPIQVPQGIEPNLKKFIASLE